MSLVFSLRTFRKSKKDLAGLKPAEAYQARSMPILAVSPAVTALTCLSATLDGSPAKGSGRIRTCYSVAVVYFAHARTQTHLYRAIHRGSRLSRVFLPRRRSSCQPRRWLLIWPFIRHLAVFPAYHHAKDRAGSAPAAIASG